MILNQNFALQNPGQRFELKIALWRIAGAAALFPLGPAARIILCIDPRLAIPGDIAHAGGGRTAARAIDALGILAARHFQAIGRAGERSEEHTSELQSLMRRSYADF